MRPGPESTAARVRRAGARAGLEGEGAGVVALRFIRGLLASGLRSVLDEVEGVGSAVAILRGLLRSGGEEVGSTVGASEAAAVPRERVCRGCSAIISLVICVGFAWSALAIGVFAILRALPTTGVRASLSLADDDKAGAGEDPTLLDARDRATKNSVSFLDWGSLRILDLALLIVASGVKGLRNSGQEFEAGALLVRVGSCLAADRPGRTEPVVISSNIDVTAAFVV